MVERIREHVKAAPTGNPLEEPAFRHAGGKLRVLMLDNAGGLTAEYQKRSQFRLRMLNAALDSFHTGDTMDTPLNRRQFGTAVVGTAVAAAMPRVFLKAEEKPFTLNYLVGSSMYGTLPLSEILPEVKKCGADFIDIWPRVHGNQREQMDELGHDVVAEMLEKHAVGIDVFTRYDLGPFGLKPELPVAKKFGATVIVTGSKGPKDAKGDALREAVKKFCEEMKPHADLAGEHGVTIAIENHANALINTPDSLKWFAEFATSPHLGCALAPYHLPQDPEVLAGLIRDLGPNLSLFYAWEHGMGCMTKLPKDQELMQMPGRGSLDFVPLLQALKDIKYAGKTEVFMHPVPRGIPILETAAEVTAEIVRGKEHLEAGLKKLT